MALKDRSRSFELLPADSQDVPRLAQIHVNACSPDPCIRLKFPEWGDFQPRVEQMLKSQVGKSNWIHLKAVDLETKEIAAWASWVTVELDLESKGIPKQIVSSEQKTAPEIKEGNSRSHQRNKETFQFLPGLGTYVQQETDRFISNFMIGKRYIRCKALYTDPKFQRRGMGLALIDHGNHLADMKCLPIILYGTPFGFPIYAARGFEIVGKLEIDLKQWVESQNAEHSKGVYTIRFMHRRTSPSTA